MKAIKDVKWKVNIIGVTAHWWAAKSIGQTGLVSDSLVMDNFLQTKSGAKRNWQRFAKLNKIKKWEFV